MVFRIRLKRPGYQPSRTFGIIVWFRNLWVLIGSVLFVCKSRHYFSILPLAPLKPFHLISADGTSIMNPFPFFSSKLMTLTLLGNSINFISNNNHQKCFFLNEFIWTYAEAFSLITFLHSPGIINI